MESPKNEIIENHEDLEINLSEVQLPKIQTGKLENVGNAKPLTDKEKQKLVKMLSQFEKSGDFKNLMLPDFLLQQYPDNFNETVEHTRLLEESEFTRAVTSCKTDEERKNKIKERLRKKIKNKHK